MEYSIEAILLNPYNLGMPLHPQEIDFARICKELRSRRKLTQKAMADKLGVGLRAYQNYEQGKQEPRGSAAFRLAQMLCEDQIESMKQKITEKIRKEIEALQANGKEKIN